MKRFEKGVGEKASEQKDTILGRGWESFQSIVVGRGKAKFMVWKN